tara:strand:- start:3359 stop:3532 length:174 start_codon:yes stop_codon:yes gene_type:complete
MLDIFVLSSVLFVHTLIKKHAKAPTMLVLFSKSRGDGVAYMGFDEFYGGNIGWVKCA